MKQKRMSKPRPKLKHRPKVSEKVMLPNKILVVIKSDRQEGDLLHIKDLFKILFI